MSGRATVIFDFDGTLANTVDLIVRIYNEHAEAFGAEKVSEKEFNKLRKLGYKKAMKLKKIKYRVVPRVAMTVLKEMRLHMDEVEPYKGIVDVLHELKKKGFSIGVLTSNQAVIANEFFNAHKFPKFDFVVSEKTLFGKDRALRRIIKRYGLENNQVLYVGDEPRDVTASHKAGIQVLGVSWGLAGREGFRHHMPDKIVDTPRELQEVIFELAGY